MKTISVRYLKKNIRAAVDSSHRDPVVVTRRGKPAAVLVGVEERDWESVVLEISPELLKLIEERRAEPTLSVDELERELTGQ